MNDSILYGIRIYNYRGDVIFTTGKYIEYHYVRYASNWQFITFELEEGEKIIGVQSYGSAQNLDVQFVLGKMK